MTAAERFSTEKEPFLKQLQELCMLCGASGEESPVREYLLQQLEPVRDSITCTIDPLGSLIVEKRGKNPAPHKVMISAHMDEVALIVTHIHSDGTLCIAPVGGVDASVVIGRQVVVSGTGRTGVIGAKPVHLLTSEEKTALPKFSQLVLDIGAESQEEAMEIAKPGTYVYFLPEAFQALGNNRIVSKAIDDRAGCALLLQLLLQETAYDFTAAFLVQEEIGLRGAKAATYTIDPAFALVLETTTAADIIGAEEDAKVCSLGKGPVLSFMDRSTIYDREMYQRAAALCERHAIPWQTKSRIAGGNDSGAIHLSRGGVRTLAVSLPCRYLHSPSCMADLTDLDAMQTLLPYLLEEWMHL